MSVVTGSPVAARTLSRIASPSSRPGPRNAPALVRLALSKDALKTQRIGKLAAIAARDSATWRHKLSRSMTHGPAITRRGSPGPHR